MISPEALEKARAIDWTRIDDALISCAGLLKTLCRDNIGDTADSELEYARSVIAALQAERDAAAPKLPDDLAGLVKELRDAAALKKEAADVVRPFAEHLDKMKFDRDNHGNLLPDEQAVGWVYVTNGHFRAARSFLNKLEGRDG